MIKYIKDNGKIIIVDYMFYDSNEKEEYKEHFKSSNREDLWDFINSRYYTNIQELKEYILKLDYHIKVDHMINFTWIVEITKKD